MECSVQVKGQNFPTLESPVNSNLLTAAPRQGLHTACAPVLRAGSQDGLSAAGGDSICKKKQVQSG